ncbi:MAG: hypothetical protein EHM24_07705 [Acidobacteria bacterium]|nr:MAG: hypothetical protein EHM24_21470 [Acidobacteriota bacterium]RPJ73561.1 MAG: hypothetical protein EHM24_07705 [Acidobacteriota bacterium]
MASIALIGPDGAGKTTLTRMLADSGILRFKPIYMGIDVGASNVALPTSRLAERIKTRLLRRRGGATGGAAAGSPSRQRHGLRRAAWVTLRLVNRLADEWYRQSVSWWYQSRGYTVLYDRHFVFDFALEVAGNPNETVDRRLHRWSLRHLYPRPSLVIFLDAPGNLLFARKGELTPEELERRRQAFLEVGRGLPAFVRVDATRPLPEVYSEVVGCVMRSFSERRRTAAGEAAR